MLHIRVACEAYNSIPFTPLPEGFLVLKYEPLAKGGPPTGSIDDDKILMMIY